MVAASEQPNFEHLLSALALDQRAENYQSLEPNVKSRAAKSKINQLVR
jgi:hypothetical protein